MSLKKKLDGRKPDIDESLATRVREPDLIELSTLQLVKILLVDKFLKRKPETYSFDHGDRGKLIVDPPPNEEKIYSLAIVSNGEVKDIIRTQEALATILTGDVEFIAFDPEIDHVHIHSIYNDGEWISPQEQGKSGEPLQSFNLEDYMPTDKEKI